MLNVITGATGLLGSHIVEQLAERGERVRALVRPASDVAFLRSLGAELVTGDLRDPRSLAHAVAGADTVYHCASRVGDYGTWKEFKAEVIDATRNVMAASRAAGVKRVLHVSSVAVYGHRPRVPAEGIAEDQPLGGRPLFWDHYGSSKIGAEKAARQLFPEVTIVRPTWVLGPRDRHGLTRLVQALRGGWVSMVGSGDNLLNIVYAADVARGAILAATVPQARGQTYHLCSEGEVTQRQFLTALTDALDLPPVSRRVSFRLAFWGGLMSEIIARALQWRRAPYISRYTVCRLGRPAAFRIQKAQRDLGWAPQTPILEGLRKALESLGLAASPQGVTHSS